MSVKKIWVLHILSVLVLICAISIFDWKNVALQATAIILAYNSKLFSLGIGSDLIHPLSACLFILYYIIILSCYVIYIALFGKVHITLSVYIKVKLTNRI